MSAKITQEGLALYKVFGSSKRLPKLVIEYTQFKDAHFSLTSGIWSYVIFKFPQEIGGPLEIKLVCPSEYCRLLLGNFGPTESKKANWIS